MTQDSEKIWKKFARDNLPNEDASFRRGSSFNNAAPWVNGLPSPAKPTQMYKNVTLYSGYINPHNMKLAKKLVAQNQSITLRGLVDEMLNQLKIGNTGIPYVWWVLPYSQKVRTIHLDADGFSFVKVDKKWQLAYSIQAMGALVGAQGNPYEELPTNAFFFPSENEKTARNYTI